MAKVFTKQGAERLQKEFEAMCEIFAKSNGITFDGTHLKYGEALNFSAKFGIAENKDEEWEEYVKYFSQQGVVLSKNMYFYDDGKKYVVTGNLNPSKTSKYKIEVMNPQGKIQYGTVAWVISCIR